MPSEFEYGKKRFLKLPKSFWQKKLESGGKERALMFGKNSKILTKKCSGLIKKWMFWPK